MELVGPTENVVYLEDRAKIVQGAPEKATETPPTQPPIADISIRLSATGDVSYERHNVNTCTARSLMMGCYVMLGETMILVGES